MKNEYPNFELICGLLGQQGTKTQKTKKQTKKDGKRASHLVLREKGMPLVLVWDMDIRAREMCLEVDCEK